MTLQSGQIVHLRSRHYLVEEVLPPPDPQQDTLVRLSCLSDDALGDPLEVLWEREVDAEVIGHSPWEDVAKRGFDDPKIFSSYLHTLRWNCVTSTDAKLFQAPYRAGIEVRAFQLEPLRKALLMPRVKLFIADDVGLGKTIEAGLILREMLIRQKIRRTVICCPPSVVRQWQEEMEQRFGLTFIIYDREFVARCRQERGYGVNPWKTHTRFIISHARVRDESYASALRDWLNIFTAGSLLILDEAHNAAPASSSQYAIDSKLTRAIRDLAPKFEHKLFLSATPHNGHSNSFAALMEILDPQRFCRGVPVDHKLRDEVMVRRLKQDVREIEGGFPERKVVCIRLDKLPIDQPELVLSHKLQAYRRLREERLKKAPKSKRNAAMLVLTSLQKRLLSSIEAFHSTLAVHTRAVKKRAHTPRPLREPSAQHLNLLVESVGADDDRATLPEADVEAEEAAQVTAATIHAEHGAPTPRELELLNEMTEIAQQSRFKTDPRVQWLINWLRDNLCPKLGEEGAQWNERRVLIFTEYTDTKRYLELQLKQAIENSALAGSRITTFHGGIGEDRREAIKAAFNLDPKRHPLRILIATDAAREGINLQNHCADLFHLDIPWNPSRMEQRNGRIDRKLQREDTVRCHYFVLPQRAEDRVLEVLVEKTKRIQSELGCLSPVLEKNLSKLLKHGILHSQEQRLFKDISGADDDPKTATVKNELETARERKLGKQIRVLRDMLEKSQRWLGLDDRHFRDALSASLTLMGATPLTPVNSTRAAQDPSTARWLLPDLEAQGGAGGSWAATLDTLRPPLKHKQKLWDWRRETSIRPVVFRDSGSLDGDVVHLHLEHRVVQRLLGRFLSQGFLRNELTRACVVLTDDAKPKVIALGRLSLYGGRAARLHDDIIAVAADWLEPDLRDRGKLSAMTQSDKKEALALLETSLATPRLMSVSPDMQKRLQTYTAQDVKALLPHLKRRASEIKKRGARDLKKRGQKEASEMATILERQRERIIKTQHERENPKQLLLFSAEERRQIEADKRHWHKRLQMIEEEIVTEPEKIRASYDVKATRIEPVGLVYLWPVSG